MLNLISTDICYLGTQSKFNYFDELTKSGDILIVSKKLLGSPVKDRVNIVLTTDQVDEGFVSQPSLLDTLEYIVRSESTQFHQQSKIYVVGGSDIITEALQFPNLIDTIYLNCPHQNYDCEAFELDFEAFVKNHTTFVTQECTSKITVLKKKQSQSTEQNYLDILSRLLKAPARQTRNAITRSLFSTNLTFDLQEGFPLFTTKRMFWKGIVYETLMFLGGCTNNKYLKERGVHIWDANTTEEFIKKCGLSYPADTMGPMYGAQYRYYGAEYLGADVDYTGRGGDQFSEVIDLLLNDPHSRRILMTSYNYSQAKLGVLYPCFLADTPVLTNSGYKPIQDITMEDKVLTHTGKFQEVKDLQKTLYLTGKRIYQIRPWYSPYDTNCTPEHPFYARQIRYGTIRNKSTGFSERLLRDPVEIGQPRWVNAENLTLDDYIGMPINQNNIIPKFTFTKKINGFKTKEISIELDQDDHYLLMGYFIGDGWISLKRTGIFHLVFCFKDEEFVTNLVKRLNITHGIKTVDKNCKVFWCHDYLFWHILKQFGHKAHNKMIPEWIHDSPKNFIQTFIDGYQRADGCVNKNGADFTTTSVNLAFSLQRLYLKLGKVSSVNYQKRPPTHVIQGRTVNQRSTYLIRLNDNSVFSHYYSDTDYVWFKIRTLNQYETSEDIYVYNFEVDTDNSYCVNNLIVHNCHSLVLQFYVDEPDKSPVDGLIKRVNLQIYIRSSDVVCGLGWNISYAALVLEILTNILCQKSDKTKYIAGKLHVVLGDYHLYDTHVRQAITQIGRFPKSYPKLTIKNAIESIEPKYFLGLDVTNFELVGYEPYPAIKAEMVA